MRLRLIPGLLILAASPLHAEVEVRVAGDRVSVHAVSAPVSEILDNLARQTGMRLTYDAPLPRQSLTATLEDRTPAEVVLSVLEGLGLNYALVMDGSGGKVEQLLILGTPVAATPPGRPTPSPPVQRPTPSQIPDFREEADDEDADAEGLLDPMEVMSQIEAEADQARATPSPAPSAAPRPPEYPSSSFSPRLPVPSPPPAPSPQPTPAPPTSQ